MKQPDTSTQEGRHAVERASRSKRIQKIKLYSPFEWEDYLGPGDNIKFNWHSFNYRIHPEDLATTSDMETVDKPDPGEGYRLLEEGETICDADEFLVDGCWYRTMPKGNYNKDIHEVYRRKIEQKWYCKKCDYETIDPPDECPKCKCDGFTTLPPHKTKKPIEQKLKLLFCQTCSSTIENVSGRPHYCHEHWCNICKKLREFSTTKPPQKWYCQECSNQVTDTQRREGYQEWHCTPCNTWTEHKTTPPKPTKEWVCDECGVVKKSTDTARGKRWCSNCQLHTDSTIEHPTYRPWTMDEVPVGSVIVSKANKQYRWVITGINGSNEITYGNFFKDSLQGVFDKAEQLDGTPCGMLEE